MTAAAASSAMPKGADSLRPHETFFSMATRSDSVVLISPLAHRRQH
jgi:hypothetical protein